VRRLDAALSAWGLVTQAVPRRAVRLIILMARFAGIARPTTFDGDKSPAKSDAKSSHSKVCGCGASRGSCIHGRGCKFQMFRPLRGLVMVFPT
jgi:hypothetical protein